MSGKKIEYLSMDEYELDKHGVYVPKVARESRMAVINFARAKSWYCST